MTKTQVIKLRDQVQGYFNKAEEVVEKFAEKNKLNCEQVGWLEDFTWNFSDFEGIPERHWDKICGQKNFEFEE